MITLLTRQIIYDSEGNKISDTIYKPALGPQIAAEKRKIKRKLKRNSESEER